MHADPSARGAHSRPFHPVQSGHRPQRPIWQYCPVGQVPQEKQPLGDGPHSNAGEGVPQSLLRGGWEHVPPVQTSWVHAMPSSPQVVPSGWGTQRPPDSTWHSGQVTHAPSTHSPSAHTPQDGVHRVAPHARPRQSTAIATLVFSQR